MSDFFNYSQPDFFKFGHDSIWLAEYAFMQNCTLSEGLILDIGAGCGIVGFELWLKFSSSNWSLCSIEQQTDFSSHWLENKERVESFSQESLDASFFLGKFQDFRAEYQFDLIVGNLPYFSQQRGRLGPNEKRNICRFMDENLLDDLFIFLNRYLAPEGRGYFVWRSSELKEWNRFFESSDFSASCLAKRGQECIIELVRC